VRKDGGLNMFCEGDVLSCGCSHKQVMGSFSGGKQPGREDDHWPTSKVTVKSKWRHTCATAVCPYDVYRETLP